MSADKLYTNGRIFHSKQGLRVGRSRGYPRQ